jgi:hypothetical protein
MPRSNKKKYPCQGVLPSSDVAISHLLRQEKSHMISKAILSGQKHGINLKHGASNPGVGDCAFESVIQNNNDRSCFTENFPMSIDWYRRIWVTDMANRTTDTAWNIYGRQQWNDGWKQMLVPGTYERGIFGDLMLPGIACGVRKILLIFNTNINSPHDPIYVVDPSEFNVRPDTEVPIVLAYNLSHYESMHPCTEADTQSTVNLVKEYQEGRYRYTGKDLPFLLALQTESHTVDEEAQQDDALETRKKHEKADVDDDFVESPAKKLRTEPESFDMPNSYEEKGNKSEEDVTMIQTTEEAPIPKLCYKLKNKEKEYSIQEADGKMECPICRTLIKNVQLHFYRRIDCGDKVDMDHFTQIHEEYRKQNNRERDKIKKLKQKEANPEAFKFNHNKAQQKTREKQKEANSEAFKLNVNKAQEKTRERQKEANTEAFKDKHNKAQQKTREKQKETNPEAFKLNHNNAQQKTRDKQKETNPEAFKLNHNNAQQKTRDKQKETNTEAFKLKHNKEQQRTREKQKEGIDERIRRQNFSKAVLFGPIFICSCCSRRLYENGVTKITSHFRDKMEQKKPGFYDFCIPNKVHVNILLNGSDDKSGNYICSTCKKSMMNGKIPSMATINGLHLTRIEEGCHLTELENNLIAQNINFQYIFCLKKSRWAATKKQMISVPVAPGTVLTTIQQLPRLPREAGVVEVKLKRKKIYDRCHKKEYIDPEKIIRVLGHLKNSGNPYYQFYDDFNTYEKRCKEQDKHGHQMIFGNDSHDIESNGDEEEDLDIDKDGEPNSDDNAGDENNYITNDPIRKHQFDHNRNTCMTNNYPEMFTDENGKQVNGELSFAPAEGNYPTNLLHEKDWDVKSWPALHPDGKFGLHHKRRVKLTEQQYFCQRILHEDQRFSKSPAYTFSAAAYIEQKQLTSKANISFMRGRKSVSTEGTAQYHLDDAFTTFDGVTNTPKYWQKVKYDMIAKLENLGPFHLFFTLSCGDTRYDENFSSFLVENGYTMECSRKDDGSTETIVKNKGERKIDKTLAKFLLEDVNDSLHEMIRTNVLTATRNFHHRVDAFKKEIMMGKNNPMKIKHISYRVEFQGRGAAHIHGTLWLDIKEIEKSPPFKENLQEKRDGNLSEAFRKLRDDIKLNEAEKDAIAKLTDMFITCSLNPDTVHEDPDVGKRIIDIVGHVNCHNCTNPCERYGDKCRYGFPKFPLKETLVVDKNEFSDQSEGDDQNRNVNYKKILSDIEDVLKDEDKVKEIMSKYEKGKTEEEYATNRAKRIDLLLEMAGNISYENYIMAIKKTRKHGSTVLLKRDVDETKVNNYNPEWAINWNANHDIQPVLDFFAVITYVTDYWAKPDEGITQYLKEAAAMLKSEPDQKKRCQQMANTFLTHRQMGEAEAYYKILPNLTLKYSSVDTIFIPTDKKELRSKFLTKLDEGNVNFAKGSEVIGGREGLFLEKPDIIDKFCRREITDNNPELEELSAIQFGKMYQPIRGKKSGKEEDFKTCKETENVDNMDVDDNEDKDNDEQNNNADTERNDDPWKDEEDRVANFYITTNQQYNYIRLPNFIKLKNPKDGEVPIFEKRSFPKAARIHKKREDNDPHRFFLSELMLYTGYTDEQQLGCDDEEMCRELYLRKKDAMQFVKMHMMPFAQGVEEARHYVQEAMKDQVESTDNIGDVLDAEQEQEIVECQDNEEHIHPDFVQLNPDELEFENNLTQVRKTLRHIEVKTADEILNEARHLDEFQKKALHVAVNFAQDVIIARKGKIPHPRAPFLMVHGGAGSGKSTLINVISQYVHHIMLRDGDDPDCPYVLLSAFTGSAASNIEGQTLHTLFSFNFGAGFMSLSDKMRDEKRNLYKNLKMLIIDEISLVDADMLYKIDLRIREITQMGVPLGNVAIFVLGDLMQMCPISGRYIFLNPRNPQFFLTSEMDPLWQKFDCVNLEINHRQGEDNDYANMLNRIRTGNETSEDIGKLKERVREENHVDIRREKDALYIFGTNKKVNQMNNRRLKALTGDEQSIMAICIHKTMKNFNPPEGKAGEVLKTPFQKELKVKIGAKVMMTYNVDTSDGLTNGARGELVGVVKDAKGNISKLVVKFERESNGREKRRNNPGIASRYPGGTPVEKVNFSFSISKSKKSVINTAIVIQFPLKLAFACTAHKIQGATIPKPQKAIVNVTDTFAAAMVYVMLSRVCALWQLFILNEFDESKMYPNMKALEELERLDKISQNKNPSNWEKQDNEAMKISSLNCRSLKKHHQDIISDALLLKSEIICLQEIWLENDEIIEDLKIPNYELHINSNGKGKGVAAYYKKDIFMPEIDVKKENMQMSKFTSSTLDVVVLYRSQQANYLELNQNIEAMTNREKPQLLIGDFNFCYLDKSSNATKKYLKENNFSQLIKEPTHIEGHLLDQAYLRDNDGVLECTAEVHSKYYTDHKGLAIIVKKGM